jgi:hypothetical protein
MCLSWENILIKGVNGLWKKSHAGTAAREMGTSIKLGFLALGQDFSICVISQLAIALLWDPSLSLTYLFSFCLKLVSAVVIDFIFIISRLM